MNKHKEEQINYNRLILSVSQILLGIQWLRVTFAMAGLMVLDREDLVISMLNNYYLVMIGFLICSGFLLVSNKLENKLK